ncbi:MAG TPA: ABC transporter permease [Candidatus Limnocylindrales bacterium]|jgi:ABC-2 type transport system permease protein
MSAPRRPEPLLPNVPIIARREYVERVRGRLFVVSTILLALLAVAVSFLPLAVRLAERGTVTRIAVVSAGGGSVDHIADVIDQFLGSGFNAAAGQPRPYDVKTLPTIEAGSSAVNEGQLDALVVVERRGEGGLAFQVLTGETMSSDRSLNVQVALFGAAVIDWVETTGSGAGFIMPGFSSATAGAAPAAGSGVLSPTEFANRRIVGMVFGILIFITIVVYGMWVAAGVVAEKTSRVMEVLIAAASARQLVIGKLLGIGLAGLTQLGFVIVPALVVLGLQDQIGIALLGPSPTAGPSLAGLSPVMLGAFVVYFVLGFALYAAIYAGAASLISRPEDLQVIALPLSLIAIAGYFQAILALTGGTAGFIRIASYIPFWSPFVMLTRLTVGRVSPAELALSLGILVLTVPIAVIVAVRVYRAGVLLYGQRPGLRIFLAAIRRPA